MKRQDKPLPIELAVEENPDACLLVSLDGRVRFWNRGAENMFVCSSEMALGQSLTDLIVPVSDREAILRKLLEIPRTGPTIFECLVRRQDGVPIYVALSAKAVGSTPDLLLVAAKDITQLKVLRDARLVESKFYAFLESTPDAMIMVNQAGRIVLANSQAGELFGYGLVELRGQPIEILLPERFRGSYIGHRDGFLSHPRTQSMGAGLQLFGRRKGGEEFPVEVSLSPIETEEGMMVMSAIRDITETNRAQAASRHKSEFLANMSHELRTPLNGVIGFAELLIEEKIGPLNPHQRDYLKDILDSGRYLLQLINDVLDLSKIEAGRMDLHLETFPMEEALEESLAVINNLAQAKQVTVRSSCSVGLVRLDRAKLRQILYNLMANAVKFSHEGGEVEVDVSPVASDLLELRVTDHGIGIRQEDFTRLFIEFEQLDSGAARHFEGSGLGLALTKKLVTLHQGGIEVVSQIGKGSTFTVILPVGGPEVVP